MELTLADAIRLNRLIEIDAEDSRFIVEPYALTTDDEVQSLRAFALEGPRTGWIDIREWSNLKVTRENFSRRARPAP